MGLTANLAWMALPTLAGVGLPSQLPSSLAGTHSGGNVVSIKSHASLVDLLAAGHSGGQERGAGSVKSVFPKGARSEGGAVVIEDFEGSFEGWQLTGNVWKDNSPFNGSEYNRSVSGNPSAMVRGFGGQKFAFTRNQSNAETGTATSDPFKIEWDTIKLKVMGGKTPETRVDLVIDGKAVFSASGDGSVVFRNVNWDIRRYKGKEAQVKIVDESAAKSFGYVGVDDIRAEMVGGVGIADSYFVTSSSLRDRLNYYNMIIAAPNFRQHDFSVSDFFGVSTQEFESLRLETGKLMIAHGMDHVPGTTKDLLARRIKNSVEKLLEQNSIRVASVLGQYLLAQAVCDWVRTHILFNQILSWDSKTHQYALPVETRARFWTTETLLKEQKLYAVCAGLTRITLDLSNELGLNCELVNGFTRQNNNSFASRRDHSWNVFMFRNDKGEKLVSPTDITQSLMTLGRARRAGYIRSTPFCLPIYGSEIGLFLWKQLATERDGGAPLASELQLSILSLEEWKQIRWDPLMSQAEFGLAAETKHAVVKELL